MKSRSHNQTSNLKKKKKEENQSIMSSAERTSMKASSELLINGDRPKSAISDKKKSSAETMALIVYTPPLGRSKVEPSQVWMENGDSRKQEDLEERGKMDREHKKRSKNWTRAETLKLIELRTALDPRFSRGGSRKSELWEEIAENLRQGKVFRDTQQCKDKWEKLTAGYKEVRDGIRDEEDNPYYRELHDLLASKMPRKEKGKEKGRQKEKEKEKEEEAEQEEEEEEEEETKVVVTEMETVQESLPSEEHACEAAKKRRKISTDLSATRKLVEIVVAQQQMFFRELLEAMEQKQEMRERIRQEREDKWRAEEHTQRCLFINTMVLLTQKLLGGDKLISFPPGLVPDLAPPPPPPPPPPSPPPPRPVVPPPLYTSNNHSLPENVLKKRSKNWKRSEVLLLIKARSEMESRFAKSTRRAALWEEMAEKLRKQGISRDGKQCREKWDKLMAEYKDVTDGRKEKGESPYYEEITVFLRRPVEATSGSLQL